MKFIKLICFFCNQEFKRPLKIHNKYIKKGSKLVMCSFECSKKFKFKLKNINKCLNCKKETDNPKFCSKSCSAIYNNSLKPKRKSIKHKCITCNNLIYPKRIQCFNCYKKSRIEKENNITLAELKKTSESINNYHSRIRDHARRIASYYNI